MVEVDTCAASCDSLPLAFMRKRSRVEEVVCANGLVIALAHSGACAVFDACRNFCKIGYLNTCASQQVIRSVYHNSRRNELLTVSVLDSDNSTLLRCCAIPLASLRSHCSAANGYIVFESDERLSWPGFVEFDDVNQIMVTHKPIVPNALEFAPPFGAATVSVYSVYSLDTYNLLHVFGDLHDQASILEIKLAPGLLMLVYDTRSSHLPLRVIDVYTGELLRDIYHLLHKEKRIEFVELFNHKVLIKQEFCCMQLLDIFNKNVRELDLATPKSFVLLFQARVFLAFRRTGPPQVYNEQGELVATFSDHELVNTNSVQKQSSSSLCVTSDQQSIVSYCKQKECDTQGVTTDFHQGSINVSDVRTGKCVAKLTTDGLLQRQPQLVTHDQADPLDGITSLYHDEARGLLLAGTKCGRVRVFT